MHVTAAVWLLPDKVESLPSTLLEIRVLLKWMRFYPESCASEELFFEKKACQMFSERLMVPLRALFGRTSSSGIIESLEELFPQVFFMP